MMTINLMKIKPFRKVGIAFTCFAAIAFIIYAPASCQDSNEDSGWQLPTFDKGCKSLMNALHKEWKNSDGELTFVVARKMFWALLLEPNSFYQEFSVDSVNFERFTGHLDKLVFWNPNDTVVSNLERQRIVAIERLEGQTYAIDSSFMSNHNDMINLLKQVKVSYVDQ